MEAVVRLSFSDPAHPDKGGELVLLGDNRLLFVPSDRVLRELDTLQSRAEETALKWGTSLVVGLAAAGAALFVKNRKPAGFILFGLAAGAAAAAYEARNYAARLASVLHTPQKISDVRIHQNESTGNISFVIEKPGLRKITVTLAADEFRANEGKTFIEAVVRAQNGG